MSDGPHRSLSMSRQWRRVAERIYNEAYGAEQGCDAMSAALAQDWHQEIPEGLVNKIQMILSNGQREFFSDHGAQELETLRAEAAGSPLAVTFIDCALLAREKGLSGEGALLESACGAITDFAARCLRQVEEHYHRKPPRNCITDIRQRTHEVIGRMDAMAIARQLLGIDMRERPLNPVKHTELDAGVPL